jgi:membrane protein DedA with SNARE-associated domain
MSEGSSNGAAWRRWSQSCFPKPGCCIGFFLPGDSLLVTAGVFCTTANPTGKPLLNILWLNIAWPSRPS